MIFLKELAVEGGCGFAHLAIDRLGIQDNLILSIILGQLLILYNVVDAAQPEPDTGDISKIVTDARLITSVHKREEEIGQVVVFQYLATRQILTQWLSLLEDALPLACR